MTDTADLGFWGSIVGYIVGIGGPLGMYLSSRRKTDVDESAVILGKWKELVEAHEAQIKAVREEFAAYRTTALAEITDLRTRLSKAEGRISELETENAGLKRAIAQNSQSTAVILGRSLPAENDLVTKLDRAGHNQKGSE